MVRFHFPTFKKSKMVSGSKKELEGPSVGSRMDSVQSAEGFLMRHVGADVQLPVKKWGSRTIRFYEFWFLEVKNSKGKERRILCAEEGGWWRKKIKGDLKRKWSRVRGKEGRKDVDEEKKWFHPESNWGPENQNLICCPYTMEPLTKKTLSGYLL